MLVIDPKVVVALVAHGPDGFHRPTLRLDPADLSFRFQLVLLLDNGVGHLDQVLRLLQLFRKQVGMFPVNPKTGHGQQPGGRDRDHYAEFRDLRVMIKVPESIFGEERVDFRDAYFGLDNRRNGNSKGTFFLSASVGKAISEM